MLVLTPGECIRNALIAKHFFGLLVVFYVMIFKVHGDNAMEISPELPPQSDRVRTTD